MGRLKASLRLGLIIVAALIVVAVGAFLGLTRTRAGQTFAMHKVLGRVESGLRGRVVFGSVHSDSGLHRQATLVEVEVTDEFGVLVFSADSFSVNYSLRGILAGDVVLSDVEIWSPVAFLSRPGAGEPYGIQTLLQAGPDSAASEESIEAQGTESTVDSTRCVTPSTAPASTMHPTAARASGGLGSRSRPVTMESAPTSP